MLRFARCTLIKELLHKLVLNLNQIFKQLFLYKIHFLRFAYYSKFVAMAYVDLRIVILRLFLFSSLTFLDHGTKSNGLMFT